MYFLCITSRWPIATETSRSLVLTDGVSFIITDVHLLITHVVSVSSISPRVRSKVTVYVTILDFKLGGGQTKEKVPFNTSSVTPRTTRFSLYTSENIEALSQNVPGSIPGRGLRNFQVTSSFCPHSVAPGSTQPPTETSTKEFP